MSDLARDNGISESTAYEYRDEGIAVLAACWPSLHGALLAAKAAGHTYVIVDGTLIRTDRIATRAPLAGWTCAPYDRKIITQASLVVHERESADRCGISGAEHTLIVV
jgi:hypothetical protein